MQKQATFGIPSNPIAEAAFNAYRQVWLAGLGAAAVTREWARTEAGKTFRTLVKEGSALETKAIRDLSERVDTSVKTATSLLRQCHRRKHLDGTVEVQDAGRRTQRPGQGTQGRQGGEEECRPHDASHQARHA